MSARSLRKKVTGKSMSSVAASHAKTSATPEREPASLASGQVFGTSSLGSLASFDPVTSSWRTSQRCLLEGWVKYSGRWPRSGMTRSGTLSQLRPLVRRTGGTASGSSAFASGLVKKPTHNVPTPTAQDHIERKSTSSEELNFDTNKSVSLDRWVAMWPTPTAAGFDCADVPRLLQRREEVKAKGINGNGFGLTLAQAVKVEMFPTPAASDSTGGRVSKEIGGFRANGTKRQVTLGTIAAHFPTPTADKCVASTLTPEMADRFRKKNRSGSFVEAMAARMWPTPTACQGHNNSAMNSGTAGRQMVAAKAETPEEATAMVGGQLNPTWVEWLMGFPLGWTDCVASETP